MSNISNFFENLPPSPGPALTPFRVNYKYLTLLQRIPQSFHSYLEETVNNVIKANFDGFKTLNHKLAGHIDLEFELPCENDDFESYIKWLCVQQLIMDENCPYLKHILEFSEIVGTTDQEEIKNFEQLVFNHLSFDTFWVNFQKKYEYNPIHNHTGMFSFVIWHKIPYHIKDEISLGAGKITGDGINKNLNGTFEFHCLNTVNQNSDMSNCIIPADKKWENMICLFPSSLMHSVNPFYSSDDYRITLSGNIFLKLNK